MAIIRICQGCGIRTADHKHHLFSQTKRARKKYGKLIDSEKNTVYLCHICHLNKPVPKLTEEQFIEVMKIGKEKDILPSDT